MQRVEQPAQGTDGVPVQVSPVVEWGPAKHRAGDADTSPTPGHGVAVQDYDDN